MRLYVCKIVSWTSPGLASWRFLFDVFFVNICLRPGRALFNCPEPVTLKRDATAFLVFILGTKNTPSCESFRIFGIDLRYRLEFFLLFRRRRKHNAQNPTKLLWWRFCLSKLLKFITESFYKLLPLLWVHHYPSSEGTRNFNF